MAGGEAGAASLPSAAAGRNPMRVTTSIMVPVWCLITVLMTAPLWAAEESATELAKKGFGNEKRQILALSLQDLDLFRKTLSMVDSVTPDFRFEITKPGLY
jgi:hypothetical protein